MVEGGSEQPYPRDLRGATARLGASMLGLVRTRLELASVEFAEERDRLQQQLMLLIAAVGLLLFAVLFVATWVVVYFWDTSRLAAIAGVALVFAAAGAVLLVMRSQAARSAPTPFAATVAEFERDRAALSGHAAAERPPPSL